MTESARISTRRRSARVLAAVFAVAAVVLLTLAPRALVSPARGVFMHALNAIADPLIRWIAHGDTERILNTIMFVPLGATIALLLRRRYWPAAIAFALVLSTCVEWAQGAIPGRVPDAQDVLWNTVGGAIGAIAVTLIRVLIDLVTRSRQLGKVTRT